MLPLFMTHAETRTVTYALAGSLALHVLLALICALWFGLSSLKHVSLPEPHEEPEVTLVFPDPVPAPPVAPPPPQERYIRTTQNTEAPSTPAKPDFISDRNTAAAAKSAPAPDGDKPLPTMAGVNYPTMELADRTFRDGQTKNDSAPSPPKTPPAPAPQAPSTPPAPPPMPKTEPQPQVAVARKEESPAEQMMKELDATLPKPPPVKEQPEEKPPEVRKATVPADEPPAMRNPEETSVPRAIPTATMPEVNPPRPQEESFQPETHRAAVKGTISNLGGEDAVNAAATPVGRYMRQVTSAIEKKWHQYRLERADAVEPGKMALRFYVNKNGKIEDLEFLFKEANPLMEDFTIEAILKANIPPIPKDLLLILDKERLPMEYNIVIHP